MLPGNRITVIINFGLTDMKYWFSIHPQLDKNANYLAAFRDFQ